MVTLRLSRLLGERRLTQADLVRMTGIRPNTISDVYHDTVDRINLDHLDRICEALECGLDELIERVPNRIRRTGTDLIVEPHGRRKVKM